MSDVVVVGAGLAGLTAALRCAEAGAKVTVLAKGVGSTHLGPGTIDVLGYTPDRVAAPGEAIAALEAGHPYAAIGAEGVWNGVRWLGDQFSSPDAPLPGYHLRGDLSANHLMPTAVGAAKPTAVVPVTMVPGDLRSGGPILVAGFRALKDFYPDFLADNLRRAGHEARAVTLRSMPETRADASPIAFARAFDDPAWRAQLAAELRGHLKAGDARIALPAVLGQEDPAGAWRDLQDKLGRDVFEVPTLPPSVAGIRVYRTLRDALRRAGARIVINAQAVGAERESGRVTAVRVHASQRERSYAARWVVLASGGWASGGLELDSAWNARETVFGLPLAHLPERGAPRFTSGYFDEQPLARAGVAVDARMRPVDGDADNLLVCGATVGGAAPWREMSGDGLSVATGYAASETILREAR
ncbi:MAG: glycerol-3-phosphate dehydrogenase subunit GlpB [Actinomycetota bacterium]|nr:glycerol-3-phosphate dehydrogenase subunit GlpB [Actinomycetota bacterium]